MAFIIDSQRSSPEPHSFPLRTMSALTLIVLSILVSEATAQETNLWDDRKVTLEAEGKYTPVVVAVWDTGVDIEIFERRNVWTNPKEHSTGTDSDGNGYIDDLHGIAFDVNEDRNSKLLMPLLEGLDDAEMKSLAKEAKGNRDIVFGIVSDESKQVFRSSFSSRREDAAKIARHLIWHGEFSHGTSMAKICVDGNPFAQILTIRQQFSHRPPAPSVAVYQKRAIAYSEAIKYMKTNSVRVANLSWSRWPSLLYKALVEHNVGESEEERIALAKQLFEIEKKSLQLAIQSAPEILFVTSAGNTGNGKSNAIPQAFELPNVISVGAADSNGDPIATNKRAVLDVSANGYKVKSKLPGGSDVYTMGTSVSAAQVTNLAAKILAVNNALEPTELKRLIVETSTLNGSVRLTHAKNAVAAAKNRRSKK
ncbi:MAG: S8 family serine peptidase [Planctomycetota bacterium]